MTRNGQYAMFIMELGGPLCPSQCFIAWGSDHLEYGVDRIPPNEHPGSLDSLAHIVSQETVLVIEMVGLRKM